MKYLIKYRLYQWTTEQSDFVATFDYKREGIWLEQKSIMNKGYQI